VSPSALRSSRLLQRGGTIAATATAIVLAGSGLALGATTHDVSTNIGTNPVPVTNLDPVSTAGGLAPTPAAGLLPKPVSAIVTPVVKTVSSTVQGLTKTPAQPPTPTTPTTPVTQGGATAASVGKPATVRHANAPRRAVPQAVAAAHTAHLPLREDAASLKPMNDMAFTQRSPESTIKPELAPAATGPLADLPDIARHGLPMAFVLAAAAILACLAAGHLGLLYERRMAQV
jgi:hypothetical protein